MQDYYHNNCSVHDNTMDQLHYTCLLLRECQHILLRDADLSIELLEAVAKARYSLAICAQWLYHLYFEETVDRELISSARKLCDAAVHLCDQRHFKWPRYLLLLFLMNILY